MKAEILKMVLEIFSEYEEIELDSLYIRTLEGFKGVYEFSATINVYENKYSFIRVFLENKPLDLQITDLENEVMKYMEIRRRNK